MGNGIVVSIIISITYKMEAEQNENEKDTNNQNERKIYEIPTSQQDVGNLFSDTTIVCEYDISHEEIRQYFKDLKRVPFQVHILYNKIDGTKMLRVIHINTTAFAYGQTYEYIIDILTLLLVINTSNISNDMTIIIRASHKYIIHTNKHNFITKYSYSRVGWLCLLWNKYLQLIQLKRKEIQWKGRFKKNINIVEGQLERLEDQTWSTRK